MRKKAAAACSQLLERASLPMLERARKLARLEQAVLELLPAEFSTHCKLLNLKHDILVLSVTSPAWVARLRFSIPELHHQLSHKHGLTIRGTEIKIQPDIQQKQSVERPAQQLSMRSAELLAQTACTLDHAGLQEALYRIAARTREV
jgi:hypothetical protein